MRKGRHLKVRVDGGRKVGLGHIYRCLSVSEMVASLFDSITFFLQQAEETTIELIKQEGFAAISLERSEDFLPSLEKEEVVLLDGYHFTAEYERAIKEKGGKIVTIDDLHHRMFYADALINHTPGIQRSDYLTASYTRLYLGLQYAMIRKEFLAAKRRRMAPDTLFKALVCFGGADPEDFTLQYYQKLREHSSTCQVKLIVGPSYAHLENLKSATQEDSSIQIKQNVKAAELVKLIGNSDFALCSASTISIECIKVGIPLYLVQTADNQESNYRYFLENDYAAKPEAIPQYSPACGEKMLSRQGKAFSGRIADNFGAIFKELLR